MDPRTPQTCSMRRGTFTLHRPATSLIFLLTPLRNINPAFVTVSETEANTVANYNGLQVMFQKNIGAGLSFRASYAYSKALSEYDGNKNGVLNTGSAGILNLYNVSQDYGLSAYDQRHTFLFNSLYQMPWDKYLNNRLSKAFLGGWVANGIWSYGSGAPININLATNQSQDDDPNIPDRPNLNPGFSNNPTSGSDRRLRRSDSGGYEGAILQTCGLIPARSACPWRAPSGTWDGARYRDRLMTR